MGAENGYKIKLKKKIKEKKKNLKTKSDGR